MREEYIVLTKNQVCRVQFHCEQFKGIRGSVAACKGSTKLISIVPIAAVGKLQPFAAT